MRFFIWIFLLLPLFSIAKENDTNVIQHLDLKIKGVNYRSEIITQDYDTAETLMLKLYNSNGDIIFYTLKDIEVDCNSEFLELGKYQITDTSIIFYSWWGSAGGCCAHPGAMKKEFVVNVNNILQLKTSIVVETPFNTKVSELDEDAYFIKNLIPGIEKDYDAKFVTGEKAINLIKLVRSKLNKEIINGTKDWHRLLVNKDYRISIPQ